MPQYTKAQLISASNATYFTNTSGGISASAVRDLNDSWITSSALLSGSNTFIGSQIISGSLTASLADGHIFLGQPNGFSLAVSTASIQLQGAQGTQGIQGLQGVQGIQGITGTQGVQGVQGISGSDGAQGAQGVQGVQGTSATTGSALITASFASTNITFTKGDASQFSLDGFATTGSNTFYGNQIISGNVLPLVDGQGDLGTDTYKWNQVVVNGQLKGSSLNTTGRGAVGTLRVGDETFPLSFLGDREIVGDGTGDNTHLYYGTSSVDLTALREIVYTQSGSNADLGNVSASFNTRIDNLSGITGSFATTGSNTFFGSNTFNNGISDEFKVNWGSASSASMYTENSGGPSQTLNITSASVYLNRGGLFLTSGSIVNSGNTIQFNAFPSASFDLRTQNGGTAQIRANADYTNPNLTHAYFQANSNGNLDIIGFGGNLNVSASGVTIQGLDYPNADGTNGQALITDGAGNLSFGNVTTNTGSFVTTASLSLGTITFTKGDGSTFPLSSFASLGPNQFTGSQEILNNSQLLFGNGFSLRGNSGSISEIGAATTIQFITEPPAGPGGTNDIKFINRVTGSEIAFINQQGGAGNNILFEGGDVLFKVSQVSGSTGKVRFGISPSNSPVGIDASNSTFTASLQQGYAWVGDFQNISTAVPTSSFAGGSVPAGTISGSAQITALGFVSSSITASSLITASVSLSTITFTKGDASTFTLTVDTGSGGGTTFTNPSVESISGSLVLSALTFNSGAANLTHLSASAQNQANLVFKNNNNTADTIISGSNNIFTNPAAPTAGFKRYVGGSNNIFLASGSVPQITGSTAFPITINNNFSNNGVISIAGPISASASGIQFNILGQGNINIGTAGVNNAEKLVGGFTVNTNLVLNGAPTIIANQNFITGSSTISNNQFITSPTIAISSSAVTIQGNLFNAGLNLRNAYWSSSVGLGTLTVARNIIQGATHVVTFTGSQPTGTTNSPQFADSQLMGSTLTGFVDVSGSDVAGTAANHSILSTMIQGYNTTVTGSSAAASNNFGSAFIGRYNAQDGNRSKTAQTIFAVGTGTSGGRKTGFLIDSGSNTFVEGTLNVSGSSTFTGSVNITGSLTITGSATIGNVLELTQLNPLPGGADGQLAVSASNLYFFSGSAWNRISFA